MAFVKAGSTATISINDESGIVSASVIVMTDDGDPIAFSSPTLSAGLWSSSATIPVNLAGHYCLAEWTADYSDGVSTTTQELDVLDHDASAWLGSLRDLKTYLPLEGHTDDAQAVSLIEDASFAIATRYGPFACPSVHETRPVFCDGSLIVLPEEAVVAGVTDTVDGTPIVFLAPGDGTLELHDPFTGMVYITATWGSDEIPVDVARAVKITAAAWYRRGQMGENNAYGSLGAIPKEADDIMQARRVRRF